MILAWKSLLSFLIGSIPFAKVAMLGTGIDITKVGSKNPGFNNVLRVSSKWRAAIALAGDISKGFLALLFLTSLTGLALLVLRHRSVMGVLLIVHLGSVLALLVTLPYGKFVHGLYRMLALVQYHAETDKDHSSVETFGGGKSIG